MRNVFAILGASLLGYGCWLIYPPAAWIVVGLLFLLAGVGGHLRDS